MKKQKKIVNSHCVEFSYELLTVLPYAYHLFKNNLLQETISGFDTKCFYFFSPKHRELDLKRSWNNNTKLVLDGVPNVDIHTPRLNFEKFSPPPLYESVASEKIIFEKPSIVITNRYNREWNKEPINYLSLDVLNKLFGMLKDKYQIVYINIYGKKRYDDDAEALNLGDYEFIRKYHPDVIIIHDLMLNYPNLTYNELQLRIFAGSLRFITSNGGLGVLASYFPGDNIIFSKVSRENDPSFYSFDQIYTQLSKCKISTARDESDLFKYVDEKWIKNLPFINILIRTSGRPNFFSRCLESINLQTYKNYSVIVSTDDKNCFENYIRGNKCFVIIQDRFLPSSDNEHLLTNEQKSSGDYGVYFGPNLYFNEMHKYCNGDYAIYLDDDDNLADCQSLKKLAYSIGNERNLFVLWRVGFPGRMIPSDNSWGIAPVVKDVSGIGYAIPVKNLIEWEPWKRGDYRIAKAMHENPELKTFWLDEVITEVRRRQSEDGFGKKDDLISSPNSISNANNTQIIAFYLQRLDSAAFVLALYQIVSIRKFSKCRIIFLLDGNSSKDMYRFSFLSHIKNVDVHYFPKPNLEYGFALACSSLAHNVITDSCDLHLYNGLSMHPLSVFAGSLEKRFTNDPLFFTDLIQDISHLNSVLYNDMVPLKIYDSPVAKSKNFLSYVWVSLSTFSYKLVDTNAKRNLVTAIKSNKLDCFRLPHVQSTTVIKINYNNRVTKFPLQYNKNYKNTIYCDNELLSFVEQFDTFGSLYGADDLSFQQTQKIEFDRPIISLKRLL